MRKRLEMRFLPILDFAEMKPQALQEAKYLQNCAYRLRLRLQYRKRFHYFPQPRLYIRRENCNFEACKILKHTLRQLLTPITLSTALHFLQARIVHGFACPTARIPKLFFPINRQRYPNFLRFSFLIRGWNPLLCQACALRQFFARWLVILYFRLFYSTTLLFAYAKL